MGDKQCQPNAHREFTEGDTIVVDADSNGKLTPRLLVPGATPIMQTDEVLAAQTFCGRKGAAR
jgi:hypothetical protein